MKLAGGGRHCGSWCCLSCAVNSRGVLSLLHKANLLSPHNAALSICAAPGHPVKQRAREASRLEILDLMVMVAAHPAPQFVT